MVTSILRVKVMHDKRNYRDIEILSNKTMLNLSEAILDSFDFDDRSHLFGFFSSLGDNYYNSPVRYELSPDPGSTWMGTDSKPKSNSVKHAKIGDVFTEVKQKMQFVFDYGDEWRFEIEVRRFGEKEVGVEYPRVLVKKGESPEQYPEYDEDEEW
jgi:hypothetical protein